jgi:hypothetical protein
MESAVAAALADYAADVRARRFGQMSQVTAMVASVFVVTRRVTAPLRRIRMVVRQEPVSPLQPWTSSRNANERRSYE